MLITEGDANIELPENVFYNPVQKFNRDLSIAVLDWFTKQAAKPLTVLEALSASGLRSVRYALEIGGGTSSNRIDTIIANDISAKAVEVIQQNIDRHGLNEQIKASCADATILMYQHKNDKFDVIDLDPYGCSAIFLDAAMQAIADGGLLCVTSTDMAILCGNSPEACYAKYGAMSDKCFCCHEVGLRIILQSISSAAARYGSAIEPLCSVSVDFYTRVFVKVVHGRKKAKNHVCNLSYGFQCAGCGIFQLQPLCTKEPAKGEDNFKYAPSRLNVLSKCQHCDSSLRMFGPIWTAPIHNETFLNELKELLIAKPTKFDKTEDPDFQRLLGLVTLISEEVQDVPLFYGLPDLCKRIHLPSPPMVKVFSAILNAGYKVSVSHCLENSMKTNAPAHIIWDILKYFLQEHPLSKKWFKKDPVVIRMIEKPLEFQPDFTEHKSAVAYSKLSGMKRYPMNPGPNWGPACRPNNAANKSGNNSITNQENLNKSVTSTDDNHTSVREAGDLNTAKFYKETESEHPAKKAKTDEDVLPANGDARKDDL